HPRPALATVGVGDEVSHSSVDFRERRQMTAARTWASDFCDVTNGVANQRSRVVVEIGDHNLACLAWRTRRTVGLQNFNNEVLCHDVVATRWTFNR
ncbi:hypothetical protein, partial [Salmonella sp. s44703]|uniref:hypothetical protein n=1 Tax=Salmonella sp. s44703 TaxID=3159646 RepID=UPI003980417D